MLQPSVWYKERQGLHGQFRYEYRRVQTDDNGLTTITTTYEYDGALFVLEVTVDAVQTHNAKDAIKSAWGVDVNISDDGALSLE